MAARSRLAALQLIDRINQHEMETLGAGLVRLRAEQKSIEDQRDALTAAAKREAANSAPDTRPYLPAYLTSVDAQQRAWATAYDQIEQEALVEEQKLLDVFRKSKTDEAVMGKVVKEIASEVDRAETAFLDDASRALYKLGKTDR